MNELRLKEMPSKGLPLVFGGYDDVLMAQLTEDDRPQPSRREIPSSTYCPDSVAAFMFNHHFFPALASQLHQRVVELGPGPTGGFGALAVERGMDYLGVDINPEAVNEAQRAVSVARYVCGDPLEVLAELPEETSVLSIRVLDLIHEGNAGNAYREGLARAITNLAVPGTISYHYSAERGHLPRFLFEDAMVRRGWEVLPCGYQLFDGSLSESLLLRKT